MWARVNRRRVYRNGTQAEWNGTRWDTVQNFVSESSSEREKGQRLRKPPACLLLSDSQVHRGYVTHARIGLKPAPVYSTKVVHGASPTWSFELPSSRAINGARLQVEA